jgi:predicted transcriptional regulator of viral defense system
MVRESVLAMVRDAGGTVTAKRAVNEGVRWEDLYRLRDEGALIELSRGVFRLGDAPPSAHLDLLAVCRRVSHGVICLGSALAYWELSDELPTQVHIAVPRGTWRPVISYPPTRAHVFAAATFALGRESVKLDAGETIAMYSPERTIVDAMRLHRQVGRDQALGGLRRYLERPGARPAVVLDYARRLRTERLVADALEALLS